MSSSVHLAFSRLLYRNCFKNPDHLEEISPKVAGLMCRLGKQTSRKQSQTPPISEEVIQFLF